MKKGFTLAELIGVVIILALIALLAFPPILNSIRKTKGELSDASKEILYNATELYVSENLNDFPKYNGNTYCVTLNDLVTNEYLPTKVYDATTGEEISLDSKVEVKVENDSYTYNTNNECKQIFKAGPIKDVVLSNFPELETNGNGCVTSLDNNYSYMGGCYIKGNPNDNYIWYSGFLWQIMGINSDGTVRLIVDETVTAIPWGASNTAENWDDSYAKDWLNNYFYPRLKGNNIIKEETWCSETTTSSSSARTACTDNLSKESAYVGLMTIDEYNLAGGSSSYLNIGQWQWTMTPYSSSGAWGVRNLGSADSSSVSNANGLRAVINVNSNVTITGGNGTLGEIWSSQAGPYVLNEDKSVEVTGKLNENATSGEYVLFAGKKYRIVDKDSNGNTKLILDGYYEETEGTVYTMSYGSNNTFSKDTGIGQKLNSDVLNWITNNSESEKAKLVSDYTWYQNNFGLGQSYTVSLNEKNPTRSIQATVGLIRIGEMLSGHSSSILTKGYTTTSSYDNSVTYWTMTPYSSSGAWYVLNFGSAGSNSVSYTCGLRAVIVVTADVTISGGNGTWSSPYQI